MAAGLDWTLWLWRDEFEVDRLRVYQLKRDGAG
jgi:hypothetical protein